MMHHHNIHHQAVGGHPGQHLSNHSLPGHHQMGPHQMHRDQNRMLGGQGVRLALCGPPGGGGRPPTLAPLPPGLQPHTHRPPPPMHQPPPAHPPYHMHAQGEPITRLVGYRGNNQGVMVTMAPNNVDMKTPPEPVQKAVLPVQQPPAPLQQVTQLPPPQPPSHQEPQATVGQILPDLPTNVANSKEKTSMCLVNELARFNKIQHQYRLTSEQGPAHCKRFVVSLRLGGEGGPLEEYSAEGLRIRAAQHAVAAEALQRTAYPRPPPRAPRAQRHRRPNDMSTGAGAIMPTVELNALTMKLGETAVYTPEGAPAPLPTTHAPHPLQQLQPYNRNSRYYNQNNRFLNNFKYQQNFVKDQVVYQGSYRVRLTVGGRVYHGEGGSPQAARHDAASQALRDLRQREDTDNGDGENSTDADGDDDLSDLKSPVSMVHEIALKFNLPVNFDVKSEKGPPHMKVFITTCTVAEHITEGEGNSKKTSKKRAAEKMLEELKKLPSVKKTVTQPETRKPKRKHQQLKKRTRNLIKEKADTSTSSESNPVSRLLQWAVGGGAREPLYSLEEAAGTAPSRGGKRAGYSATCKVAGHHTQGDGASKKLAKRDAAQKMLALLGVAGGSPVKVKGEVGSPGPGGGAGGGATADRSSEARGRQLAPGLLLVQDSSPAAGYLTPNNIGVNAQTAKIAKEFLRVGKSPTADALAKQEHNHRSSSPPALPISSSVVSSSTGGGGGASSPAPASPSQPAAANQVIRPKDQLLYLAKLLGFRVQFAEFPKGNHEEFLSLITLSTVPPLICHGVGPTTEQSHDQSALAALQNLSQMGLDSVTPPPPSADGMRDLPHNNSRGSLLTNGITK